MLSASTIAGISSRGSGWNISGCLVVPWQEGSTSGSATAGQVQCCNSSCMCTSRGPLAAFRVAPAFLRTLTWDLLYSTLLYSTLLQGPLLLGRSQRPGLRRTTELSRLRREKQREAASSARVHQKHDAVKSAHTCAPRSGAGPHACASRARPAPGSNAAGGRFAARVPS